MHLGRQLAFVLAAFALLFMSLSKSSSSSAGYDIVNGKLEPYATRLPKSKKTGNMRTDRCAELNHSSLQKVISLLMQRPDMILQTLASLQAQIMDESTSDISGGDMFDGDVKTLNKIPEEWWAAWVQNRCEGALADQIMLSMLAKDPAVVSKLRIFGTQLSGCISMPKECIVRKVCARVLTEHTALVFNPLSKPWVLKHVAVDGVVDWRSGGCSVM